MSLIRYSARRLLQSVFMLAGIATITFLLVNAMPGDPVRIMLGPGTDQATIDAVQSRYGLDRPLYERYFNYMAGVAQGDLGNSIHYNGVPVTEKILERLPVTLLLVASSFTLAISMAVPLGAIAAKRQNKATDHVSRVIALVGVSTPSFWIGLMLIIVFAYQLDVFPSSGLIMPWASPSDVPQATNRIDVLGAAVYHLVLPTITLGTLQTAAIMRIQRSSMLEVLNRDYITLAQAYGVSSRTVLRKHALRNAQLPVVTIIGIQLTTALGGAVLTETVFSISGMGTLIITAVNSQDYPLIMGVTLVFGVIFVVGVLITDLLYAYLDPRITYGGGEH
ncbi:ABC transporter permease [Natronorubrum halophilum]|uniref:ABC transporter permease n=1 Tax=Natronorubrum halophilum TaxID=1702106 RepID=UPI0014851E43|nr:ABC transporter permease [Natronorubrum halophilum]